ncbi:MAG TPA: SGNH/GDSL hydrolase family protein [Pyrinomonadaceae bacterium]|jgi:lysophospholipase L1-like esterase
MIKRFALLFSSVIFFLLLVLFLEAGTRILKPEINFQDTERSLLRDNAYGDTYGWKPNATGICFGKRVYTDEFGFRKMTSPQNYKESWLILGDSVTFGVGVETKDTYAQLLQDDHPEIRAWNTAVIGYNARNYRDVLYHLTQGQQGITNLKRVLLFFCLNDVDLGQALGKDLDYQPGQNGYAETLLSFLRRNSKFYMLLKNTVSDRSKFYFNHDYQFYTGGSGNFLETMSIYDEMNRYLQSRNIELTVVILPYEYQLRTKEEKNLLPQKLLTAYFKEKGIQYIDAYDYFARSGGDAKEDYLYADFGHFSKKGHRAVFNLLKERLDVLASTASSSNNEPSPAR